MSHAKTITLFILAATALAALCTPIGAHAQPLAASGDVVVLSGPARVGPNDRMRSMIALEGPTQIEGFVRGDVIALAGDVDVVGEVGGSVTALAGEIRVKEGARVGGDLVSRNPPLIALGAHVRGRAERLETQVPTMAEVLGRLASWLAVSASLFALAGLLGWLLPLSTANAVYDVARRQPMKTLGVGLLVAVALPGLALVAMISLVGIPLGIAVLFAIGLVSSLGYAMSGWILGRRITEGASPLERVPVVVVWALGVAVLRLSAIFPGAALAAWVLVSAFGAGAVFLALLQARKTAPSRSEPVVTRPETTVT